ncbi:MAG TPA: M23 family metallopeptidase [Blastocatellia bacterium]|nr:M23 family metallopeptidase [Blastocatellia bacterium]
MILGMRYVPPVRLIVVLLLLLITDLNIARIGRARTKSRLNSAASANTGPGLSIELPATLQDPPGGGPASSPPSSTSSSTSSGNDYSLNLIIPVEGVRPNDLRDTFNAIRSGGRLHRAIDIIAPRGTPVLAAADGEIIRLSFNNAGGVTIYQMSDDKKLVYYYAHLDRYADDLAAGDYASQGDVIGYVGNTGNAAAGSCHLHFSIWVVTDPKKYWTGDNINPYPILREADDAISESVRNKRK